MLLCFCETLKLMFVRTSIGSDGRMVNTAHYVMVPGKYFPSQRQCIRSFAICASLY
ncbi:hypothetical protein QUC31_010266 [Theobroma cacao]